MFGLFRKNPAKKLEAKYSRLLEEARDLQRYGDIEGFARKSAEADQILQQIKSINEQTAKS